MRTAMTLSTLVIFVVIAAFSNTTNTTIAENKFQDTLSAQRQHYIDEILNSLKGREAMPADSVFKNLKTFTGTAGVKVTHLTAIMNYWATSLGVNCTYCHNTSNWPSDEKQTKQIARDMFAMRQTINGQILKNINGLQSKTPRVNCGTCHAGKAIPKE